MESQNSERVSELTKWTITEPGKSRPERPKETKRQKIEHYPAYAIDEKTSKTQVLGAQRFNTMRQRLLDIGEMESK